MDIAATYHHGIDTFLTVTGMTDKEAHLHVGLAIYVGVQLLLRTRRASFDALIAVAGCELANELMDYFFVGELRVMDTLGDIVATMAWPTVLFMTSRYRRTRWARDAQRAPRLKMRKRSDDATILSRRATR